MDYFLSNREKIRKFRLHAKPIPTNLYHCRHFVVLVWIIVIKSLEHPLHQLQRSSKIRG